MSLRELYQEMILDHGKNPRNFGIPAHFSHAKKGHNPLCGDQFTIYLTEDAGIIKDIKFEGAGCAISVASASLMTEAIKGKPITEANELFEQFHVLLTQSEHFDENTLGKLTIFSGVREFPMRVKCATLAWHTLNAALTHSSDDISTE